MQVIIDALAFLIWLVGQITIFFFKWMFQYGLVWMIRLASTMFKLMWIPFKILLGAFGLLTTRKNKF